MTKSIVICPNCKKEQTVYSRNGRVSFICCKTRWKIDACLSPKDAIIHKNTKQNREILGSTPVNQQKKRILPKKNSVFDEKKSDFTQKTPQNGTFEVDIFPDEELKNSVVENDKIEKGVNSQNGGKD